MIKAEWTKADALDLQTTCNQLATDCINRQAAIDMVEKESQVDGAYGYMDTKSIVDLLNDLPSAQPEVKPISYADCANALMMMWIDKVLTDGEYKKIMDKLNAHEMKKREGKR